jgi:hypothetical protein
LAHPHLSWHLIALGELARYLAAVHTVLKDWYYGYSKDLDKVKSANYRHLGYIFKGLMVIHNNENHSNDNKVFSVKPPRYAVRDKILKMYGEALEAEGD